MDDAMRAETVSIVGAGKDEIEAYLAQPVDRPAVGGVVVIHHMPGYDESTKEITRKFAAHGYLALCPNLHWHDTPGASPDDAAAAARANGGVPDERLVGDVAGAVAHLKSWNHRTGRWRPLGIALVGAGERDLVYADLELMSPCGYRRVRGGSTSGGNAPQDRSDH